MRILCVTSSYPRHARDTAGRFVHDLARALVAVGARDGDTMHVLAPDDDGAIEPGGEGAVAIEGVSVTRVRYALRRRAQRLFYRSGAPENLARERGLFLQQAPWATSALALAVKRRAPAFDVVLAHWMVPAGLAAIVGARAAKKRVVVVAHSGDVHLLEHLPFGLGARLARFIARNAHAVCAVADHVRERLCALGVGAQTLPLGADLVRSSAPRGALRARLRVDAARLVVLALGRLERVKGHDVLIDALAGLPVTLLLAGDGSERAALLTRAADRGVDLRAVGFADAQGKADLFHACDVVAFPSRRLDDGRTEGLPVSLLEARLAGCPIIASDAGGLHEALREGDRIVPAGDAAALRDAIVSALAFHRAGDARPARHEGAHAAGVDPYSLTAAAARYRAVLAAAASA